MSQRKLCDDSHYFLLCHHDTELMVSNVGYSFNMNQTLKEVERILVGREVSMETSVWNTKIKMTSTSHVHAHHTCAHTHYMKSLMLLEQFSMFPTNLWSNIKSFRTNQIKSDATHTNHNHTTTIFWLLLFHNYSSVSQNYCNNQGLFKQKTSIKRWWHFHWQGKSGSLLFLVTWYSPSNASWSQAFTYMSIFVSILEF